jgi:hypothetical protein
MKIEQLRPSLWVITMPSWHCILKRQTTTTWGLTIYDADDRLCADRTQRFYLECDTFEVGMRAAWVWFTEERFLGGRQSWLDLSRPMKHLPAGNYMPPESDCFSN